MRYLLVLLALSWVSMTCGDSGAAEYRVTVSFNASVAQEDVEAVEELISSYDDGAEFLVQESFPPTGVARLDTDVPEFCRTIRAELEGRSYVAGVSCERDDGDADSGDPDEPVAYP